MDSEGNKMNSRDAVRIELNGMGELLIGSEQVMVQVMVQVMGGMAGPDGRMALHIRSIDAGRLTKAMVGMASAHGMSLKMASMGAEAPMNLAMSHASYMSMGEMMVMPVMPVVLVSGGKEVGPNGLMPGTPMTLLPMMQPMQTSKGRMTA